MANSIGAAFRSIWHTMTSNDRHFTVDSPYRTGRHVPLGREGMGELTSVATATDSRGDISSPYGDDHGHGSVAGDTAYGGSGTSSSVPTSPRASRPYSPGMRSLSAKRVSTADGFEVHSPTGEIPMQSFHDGLPPPPPVTHTWARIDAWAEDNYPELFDQLGEGCTTNDLNELEHQLDCSLPDDVRESLQVHDGQERGGIPTGIIFGAMLLDCEEMVQEWENWRKVNHEFLLETAIAQPSMPSKAFGGSNQASSSKAEPSQATSGQNPMWRQDLLARQDSVPPMAVQKAYAHPAWIPMARDWGGNNLAVDLAPGPKGTWGQVILFGRDYDTKYVVARSWASFLAMVADDLNSGKWFVDEDTSELKLREFKKARVEPPYFEILRWRMDQKYGRRAAKRRSGMPPGGPGSPPGSASPYAGPADAGSEPRGRSMHRFSTGTGSGTSPMVSPNPGYGKSSPLARVAEEAPASASSASPNGAAGKEKLVEVETPRVSGEDSSKRSSKVPAVQANGSASSMTTETKATVADEPSADTAKATGKQPEIIEEAMKTIEI